MQEEVALSTRPMDDPYRFCGRYYEIIRGLRSTQIDGSHLVIYGPRGIGKSSLAVQFQNIADGYLDLLERYEIKKVWKEKEGTYWTFNYTIDDTVNNIFDLLMSLQEQILIESNITPTKIKQPSTIIKGKGINGLVKYLGIKLLRQEEYVLNGTYKNYIDAFFRELEKIRKYLGFSKLLLILDEIENIKDKQHLAHFIRKCPSHITLVIVGIAENLKEMLHDHESVYKQIALGTIKLEKMQPDEIKEILIQTERKFPSLEISEVVKNRIVALSDGLPWFTALFLELCFRSYEEVDEKILDDYLIPRPSGDVNEVYIDIHHLNHALKQIKSKKELDLLDYILNDITNSDNKKKYLIYSLAQINEDVIEITKIRKKLLELGFNNYNKMLMDISKRGKSILKVGRGIYKFNDSLLKNYMKIVYRETDFL